MQPSPGQFPRTARFPAGPAGQPSPVLIERYADTFDLENGGGIEVACFHLGRALEDAGVGVRWYTRGDWTTADEFESLVVTSGASMVLPLVDSPVFARAAGALAPDLRRRIVRLWHDVSLLAPPTRPLPICPRHGAAGGAEAACTAAAASPDGYAANVFFFDDAWTRCFSRRRYIPWAVDHLPVADHRSPDGPVVLLVGKMRTEYAQAILDDCERSGVAVRVIFSNWSMLGQQSRLMVLARPQRAGLDIVDHYDLTQDHARVFGGASAALVLSQYRETFNFLAAEAVHFGIPVVAFAGSGGTLRFASAVLASVKQVIDLLRSGAHARLAPIERPAWGWADVAAAYAGLARDVRRGWDGGGSVRHARRADQSCMAKETG